MKLLSRVEFLKGLVTSAVVNGAIVAVGVYADNALTPWLVGASVFFFALNVICAVVMRTLDTGCKGLGLAFVIVGLFVPVLQFFIIAALFLVETDRFTK